MTLRLKYFSTQPLYKGATLRLHFLNVKNGDCSIIEHSTVIDISNGKEDDSRLLLEALGLESAVKRTLKFCTKIVKKVTF